MLRPSDNPFSVITTQKSRASNILITALDYRTDCRLGSGQTKCLILYVMMSKKMVKYVPITLFLAAKRGIFGHFLR